MSNANIIQHRDAFRIHLNPELSKVELGQSIYDVLFQKGYFKHRDGLMVRSSAFVVLYNGQPLMQKDWNTMIEPEDLIQVIHLPRGGGKSSLGNILGAILVAVMAYFTFGMSLVASVAIGAVAYAGLSLMGAQVPTGLNSLGRDKQSPTYNLNAQSNEARLLEAIPRVYGRMRTFPDLASQPYSEFKGNTQWLYQLLCITQGDNDIEQVLVEDNDITSFEDAQIQIVKPGQAVTLFPDNVVTSDAVSNLTMLAPDHEDFIVLGPFISSPSGTKANHIGIDIVLASGLGTVDDKGKTQNRSVAFAFSYREVDNNGAPVGSWISLIAETLTYATQEAQMLSYKVPVPLGRYEVRGQRTTLKATDNRTFDTVAWAGMRAYLESTFVYPGVTLVAVAMRASNVLNSQTARKISVISKSLLQKWDPINGYTQATFTNNPAWVAMDILRNTDYGRGLETSRFNVVELHRLASLWEARGDLFNGVFDNTIQLWEALTKALRVGRCTPIPYAGVIDFVRDEPKTVPNAMFQPSNMLAGSFKTDYSFFTHETPDHVIMEYIDPVTWSVATVKCTLPGEPAERGKSVELFGCTNRDHAWREGMSLAAANRDRRRNITFSTTKAGLVPYFNSLARVAHDVPQWGYFGRVLSLDPVTGRLRTTEPIVFDGSPQHVIAFRKKNGSEDGPYTIVPDPTAKDEDEVFGCIVVASQAQRAAIYISDGVRSDLTYYQCGPTEREGLLVLVQSAKPNQDGTVNITAINYSDTVYSAENGGLVPIPPPASNLPITPSAPIVDWVQVVYTTTIGVQNIIASPARGAIYYEFRASQNPAVENLWLNLQTSDEPRLQSNLSPGQWRVQVRGVGRLVGPWASWDGQIEATSIPTAKIDVFTGVSKLFAVGLGWVYAAESLSIVERVEIWVGITNVLTNAVKLADLPYPANTFDHIDLAAGQSFFYWIRAKDSADRYGDWYNGGVPIQAGASTDAVKILEFLTGKITSTQLAQDLLDPIESITPSLEAMQAQVDAVNAQLAEVIGAPTHDTADTYLEGTLVQFDGKLYRSIQDVPTGIAITNTAYWELVGEYASIGEAVAAHSVAIQELTTRATETEQGLLAETQERSTLAAQVRGDYTGTNPAMLTQGLAYQERLARASGDEANATAIQGVSATLTALAGPSGPIAGNANAISTLTTRVADTEEGLESTAERIDLVEARISSGGADALVVDPELELGAESWAFVTGLVVLDATASGVPAAAPAKKVTRLDASASSVVNWTRKLRGAVNTAGDAIRVTPNEVIDISTWANVAGTIVAGATSLRVLHGPTEPPTTSVVIANSTANGWQLLGGSFTVPAGSIYLSVAIRRANTGTEGFAYVAGVQAERRSAGTRSVSAAVLAEATTRAQDDLAEAAARQLVVANITSGSSENLVKNPTFDPAGHRDIISGNYLSYYQDRTPALASAGWPTARVWFYEKKTAVLEWAVRQLMLNPAYLLPVRVGDVIDVSVWMIASAAPANSSYLWVYGADNSNNALGNSSALYYNHTVGGWQKLRGTFTVSAGATLIGAQLAMSNQAPNNHQIGVGDIDIRKRSASSVQLGAAVETNATAIVESNNKAAAMYTIKTQLTVGGVPYIAGIGVGVENNQGIITSQVLLAADRVAVLNTANGVTTSPFIIQGGQVIINDAIIGLISANKINVGLGGNMLPNSSLVTMEGWTHYDTIGGVINAGKNLLANYVPTGENTLQIYQQSGNNPGTWSYWFSPNFAVEPNKRYEFSVLTGAYMATVHAYMEIYNAALDTWVAGSQVSGNLIEKYGGKRLSDFKLLGGFLDSPSTGAVGRLIIRKLNTEVGSDSLMTITRPQVCLAGPNQTSVSAYNPTGQGVMITPQGIVTPNLSSLSADVGLLRTQASGGRMEIYSNVVKSFDDSNMVRAKFGNLNL